MFLPSFMRVSRRRAPAGVQDGAHHHVVPAVLPAEHGPGGHRRHRALLHHPPRPRAALRVQQQPLPHRRRRRHRCSVSGRAPPCLAVGGCPCARDACSDGSKATLLHGVSAIHCQPVGASMLLHRTVVLVTSSAACAATSIMSSIPPCFFCYFKRARFFFNVMLTI